MPYHFSRNALQFPDCRHWNASRERGQPLDTIFSSISPSSIVADSLGQAQNETP